MRRQDPSQITGRHDPDTDWREVEATTYHGLSPPKAFGRPLCAVWTKQHTALEEDLTRPWAEGPANCYTYSYHYYDLHYYDLIASRIPPGQGGNRTGSQQFGAQSMA